MTRRRSSRTAEGERRLAAIQRDLAFVEALGDTALAAKVAHDSGQISKAEYNAVFERLKRLEDLYDSRQLPPPAMKS